MPLLAGSAWVAWGGLLLLASAVEAFIPQQASVPVAPPRDVTYCELAANPRQFHQARIRITAFVEFEFEHFQLTDPTCPGPKNPSFDVWVTFGGNFASGAVYCCPGEGMGPFKSSKKAKFPLVDDRAFREFWKVLNDEGDTTVRLTVVGTLLVKPEDDKQTVFNGWGHFGCCSLFVIEQVESFEPHDSKLDLDYSSAAGRNEGRICRIYNLRSDLGWNEAEAIRLQRAADAGERGWALDEPKRVALEAVRAKFGDVAPELIQVKRAPGREVFEWRHDRSWTTVVVIRPYLLSFFAKTANVAWVASHMETATCGIDIKPDQDIRAQVLAVMTKAAGEAVNDRRLKADVLANPSSKFRPGPKGATFFDLDYSYAMAVETDEHGWPSWIDVRPMSQYPVPFSVWPDRHKDIDIYVPMYRDNFEGLISLFDSLRPLGSPTGPVRRTANFNQQEYEHAVLTWEDATGDKPSPYTGVLWFSVKWNLIARATSFSGPSAPRRPRPRSVPGIPASACP